MNSVNRVPINISWTIKVAIVEQNNKQNIPKEVSTTTHTAQPEFQHFVRILNTDLEGAKKLNNSLRKIKGIGSMLANAICSVANINRNALTGELTKDQVNKLEGILKDLPKSGLPAWMLNRRKDYETGEDKHLFTADLNLTKDDDIKKLKKIKSYKGVRHMFNLPVRGQKTKSNFRPNKGKAKLGVKKPAKTGKT